jgi:hypothetical protein
VLAGQNQDIIMTNLNNEIADFKKIKYELGLGGSPDNPNVGLMMLAMAVNRVAQSINELELRIVTKKPEGL